MDNKTTYGTVPTVKNLGTKGSRRGLVVGLVRPRARKNKFHGTPSTRRLLLTGRRRLLRARLRGRQRRSDPRPPRHRSLRQGVKRAGPPAAPRAAATAAARARSTRRRTRHLRRARSSARRVAADPRGTSRASRPSHGSPAPVFRSGCRAPGLRRRPAPARRRLPRSPRSTFVEIKFRAPHAIASAT